MNIYLVIFIFLTPILAYLEYELLISVDLTIKNFDNLDVKVIKQLLLEGILVFLIKCFLAWIIAKYSMTETISRISSYLADLLNFQIDYRDPNNKGFLDTANYLQSFYQAQAQILSNIAVVIILAYLTLTKSGIVFPEIILLPIFLYLLLNYKIRRMQNVLGSKLQKIAPQRLSRFLNIQNNLVVATFFKIHHHLKEKFIQIEKEFRKTQVYIFLLGVLPRYILDLIMILSIVLIAFSEVLTTEQLSIFAVFTIRLLPYISIIFLNLSKYSAYKKSTEFLRRSNRIFRKEMSIDNYNDQFTIEENTVITGASGSGKTSLMMDFIGVPIDKEIDSSKLNARSYDTSIFMQRNPELNVTVIEFIHLLKVKKEYLNKLELESLSHTQDITSLSGGELQRLWLAAAFSQSSQYLFLDEPTNNLDQKSIGLVLDLIKCDHRIKLIITHDPLVRQLTSSLNYKEIGV